MIWVAAIAFALMASLLFNGVQSGKISRLKDENENLKKQLNGGS